MLIIVSVVGAVVIRRFLYPEKDRQPIDYVGVALCAFVLAVIFQAAFP